MDDGYCRKDTKTQRQRAIQKKKSRTDLKASEKLVTLMEYQPIIDRLQWNQRD